MTEFSLPLYFTEAEQDCEGNLLERSSASPRPLVVALPRLQRSSHIPGRETGKLAR